MPEISSLTRQKPVAATIDLGDGDIVNLTFDRNRITPAWVEKGREEQFLSQALSEVIISWDVTQDGNPYPATPENMALFSFAAQGSLLERIVEESLPSRAEGNDSPSPSSTVQPDSSAQATTPPNGVATSTSALPLASPSPT